ncbi:SHOCT domain-containing protein [Egbenema bharatensis]|uniref:SHOCT domain-containing protein n=1 Tax=Egbenema bharatensis TaxID=3463334 RepID=UPI003A8984FF
MSAKNKDRRIAALLAFASAIPIPFFPSGLHKFYLGQLRWGAVYWALSFTPIPRFASVLEGAWYLFQDPEEFDSLFNALPSSNASVQTKVKSSDDLGQIATIADALRQLDQLRQDGLISEYEFEQKRRYLLDQMG